MPTYQYACKNCDHRFEAVQSFSDPSLTVCPECDGQLRKVFNSVGIVFKGSGFYHNDSRSSSNLTPSSGSSDAKSDASGSESKSSESTSSESKGSSAASDSSSSASSKKDSAVSTSA